MASRRRKRKRRAPISDQNAEFLKAEFGTISKGVEELVGRYRFSLGPKSPTLKLIFNALFSRAEASEGEISWTGAIETVCRTLGCEKEGALKYIQEMFKEGYLTHGNKQGYVKVLSKRSVEQLW